jgi:hypothetical protein
VYLSKADHEPTLHLSRAWCQVRRNAAIRLHSLIFIATCFLWFLLGYDRIGFLHLLTFAQITDKYLLTELGPNQAHLYVMLCTFHRELLNRNMQWCQVRCNRLVLYLSPALPIRWTAMTSPQSAQQRVTFIRVSPYKKHHSRRPHTRLGCRDRFRDPPRFETANMPLAAMADLRKNLGAHFQIRMPIGCV